MNFITMKTEPIHVIGVRRITAYSGGTWTMVKSDGSLEKMHQLAGDNFIPLGLCFGFGGDGSNDYLCGVEYAGEKPSGFDQYVVSPSTWLVFEAKGAISEDALGHTWKCIYEEFLPASAYRQRELPTIERYIQWDEKNDQCSVEIMIPIEG